MPIKEKSNDYTGLNGKTIDEVYHQLPLGGFTRIFTEWTGIYYPDRDKKKYGDLLVNGAFEFTPTVLFLSTLK